MITRQHNLALYGGPKTRIQPMPARMAFGLEEEQAVLAVFQYYRARSCDFGYQGHFEEIYTDAFVRYMGIPGYADVVCTGTAALYVAIAALRLAPGSRVLVSPVTDPGTINAIILNQLIPVVMDSSPGSFNVDVEQFEARLNDSIKAAIIVHCAGKAAPIDLICDIATSRGIPVIEDCSQAHGATLKGQKVGTFGDIGVFSTMYRKAHATGGCGGVIFTKNQELFYLIRAASDRGKPFHQPNFNEKDPSAFLFPALNLNIDEISCAIGLSSLAKLDQTISKRTAFLLELQGVINQHSKTCRPMPVEEGLSPFFHPIMVFSEKIRCTKIEFAEAIKAEGIDVNSDYRYVVSEWPWMREFLSGDFSSLNATAFRNSSFNLLFNENYGMTEIDDICTAITKVENYFLK